jgi:hypothetical protein
VASCHPLWYALRVGGTIKSPLLYQLSYAPEGPLNIFAPNRLDNPTALTHSRLPLVPGAKMVALLFGFMPV